MKSLLFLLIFIIALANAQSLTAEEILAELEQSAKSLEDAEFLLTGKIIDSIDNTEIELEIECQLISKEEVGKAYFIKPEALADNFIVYNEDTVYNYLFLTNQVTVLDARDPDALGGLFPEAEDAKEDLNLDLSLESLFVDWDVSILDYGDTPLGKAYHLRFDDTTEDEDGIDYVIAVVLDDTWDPYKLSFYEQNDYLLAELQFNDFQRNIDLDSEEVIYIPEDAEVIDER